MDKQQLYKDVTKLLRSKIQSNMIENITPQDLETALNMTVSKINTTKPVSNLSVDDLLDDDSINMWYTIIIDGVAYYTITSQITEWMHNGIDVNIEDLSVSDKMDAYITVADRFKDELETLLENIKTSLFRYTSKRVLIKDVNSIRKYNSSSSSVSNFYTKVRIGRIK